MQLFVEQLKSAVVDKMEEEKKKRSDGVEKEC
jgi:hypothetical protein